MSTHLNNRTSHKVPKVVILSYLNTTQGTVVLFLLTLIKFGPFEYNRTRTLLYFP
jgi:uncharacterized membrane protein YdcZ (DUF606 family)